MVLVLRSDPVFPLVFVWAAFSIRTYHQGDETVRTAAGLAALVVLVADLVFVRLFFNNMLSHGGEEAPPSVVILSGLDRGMAKEDAAEIRASAVGNRKAICAR